MNLGSILGLGCLCRPFPAGFTNLGGGRQPRSIGLSTWTVFTWTNPDILGNSCQKAAPSIAPFIDGPGGTTVLCSPLLPSAPNWYARCSLLGQAAPGPRPPLAQEDTGALWRG